MVTALRSVAKAQLVHELAQIVKINISICSAAEDFLLGRLVFAHSTDAGGISC